MGIHVVQSQRVDVLVQAMLSTLQSTTDDPFAVLRSQHVIVPSSAVQAWLEQKIAEQHGISANMKFYQRIRGFQWDAYQAVLPNKAEVRKANIPRIIIQWRVYQALINHIQAEKNTLSENHPLYSLIQRIYDSAHHLNSPLERQLKKERMLYWVAAQVSRLFSHYMTYRGECQGACPPHACECVQNWLQYWGNNQALALDQLLFQPKIEHEHEQHAFDFKKQQSLELEAWQRWLWKEIFHQDFEAMQQIDQDFWQLLNHPEHQQQALEQLPEQLVVFTLLELPPVQLQFLRRLGQYIEIFVFHYNPSREYWADMVDPHWKDRVDAQLKDHFIQQRLAKQQAVSDEDIDAFMKRYRLNFEAENRESHHPLLTRFGKQARDHFSLLSKLSAGEEGEWYDIFPEQYPETLLGKIQSDILFLAEPQQHQYPLQSHDQSIQIHVCHSSLRQLEVLKDQLIHWLAQGNADDPRAPQDILVLSPDVKELEPLIRSVFAPPPSELRQHKHQHGQRLSQDSVYLPIKIAGVMPLDTENAWQAVLGRIQLLQSRFSVEQLSDWLSLEATQQYYGIDIEQVQRMLALLIESGFKRGFDEAHLKQSLTEGDDDYRFSFKFALDRLALGIAIPEHAVFGHILSFSQVRPDDFHLIGILLQIYQDLDARREWMIQHEQEQAYSAETCILNLMQDVKQFIQQGVDALQTVYKLLEKQRRMLSLAIRGEQEQPHNRPDRLSDLTLPLAYIIAEIDLLLLSQVQQAEPTGSITFSQIGQIRPLPYKLVVMLNLDSGKFPNRDQHIPFDLMEILRPQLGDRSRLEDDQGAFLDALLLAQQYFWIFYNGFDVSDGEVRDPSTVVQELIQHLDLITVNQNPEQLLSDTVKINEVEIAAQLQGLYHFHPLQPFDLEGFGVESHRFQDQWFKVASQLGHASSQRSPWVDVDYEPVVPELQVISSYQWIGDVLFPARAYLKALGIKNLSPEDIPAQQEPLLLGGLDQYHIRDAVLNEHNHIPLLQDLLPIGKTQHATWQMTLLAKQHVLERMQHYATEVTTTTHYRYSFLPYVVVNLVRPKDPQTTLWIDVVASSAGASRRARVWLEYLWWLASLQLGDGGSMHQRICVCHDQTIVCAGVSSNQAYQMLEQWWLLSQQAQCRPVVLPAELILRKSKDFTAEWDDAEQAIVNLDRMCQEWRKKDTFSAFSFDASEWNIKHRDWQFILQDQESQHLDQMLKDSVMQFGHDLYYPLIRYQQLED